ncbi:MAG: chitobiase/beta-hexosaminidase C-terminal domain-containing protein [Deferribacteres bacterium]|nr:chitobiase/beta-hexosaminidase C-terminal domain-containing protein [candidate division KSB1 bacterium]MCB9504492.1 chitobiase/beta-hexosaminidase C-terminal domain-containing protein [Deferribacteres bacterium]
MVRHLKSISLLLQTFLLATLLHAQDSPEKLAIISVERIWDRAQHSAFTSLAYFNNRFFCTFREGTDHTPGINGTIRIISSADGQNWTSVALLDKKDMDLRDPMLSVTPDNRLMLNCGGSRYVGKERLGMQPYFSFSDHEGRNFSPVKEIEFNANLTTGADWLWRSTWHKGSAYAAVYQPGKQELQLVKTTDGMHYDYLTQLQIPGFPNETTLRFTRNDEMIALVRRDSRQPTGFIGSSRPPYKTWEWHELDIRLGGPDLLILKNGAMLCGTREYRSDSGTKMMLGKITRDGAFTKFLNLPSAGDCSYPGLLLHDGILYVSYYASHEEKTAIYFARIRMDYVQNWLDMEMLPAPQIKNSSAGNINLSCDAPKAEIHYTLDGSIPDFENGTPYTKPIQVSRTTTLRAIALQEGKLPSRIFSTEVGTDIYQEAQTLVNTPKPGLAYSYHETAVRSVDYIDETSVTEQGVAPEISLMKRHRNDDFAFVFKGYINVPQEGLYEFFLNSNDGSVLSLNNTVLIDNDGPHGPIERSTKTSLRKGYHKFELKYFQMGGGKELTLQWQGPDMLRTDIPASAFFH